MATGQAKIMVGGTYTTGPEKGAYHAVVGDSQVGEAQSGRPQIVLEFICKNDPDHPAREGKSIGKMWQSLPTDKDDAEKSDKMRGMIKRMLFDAFGNPWPTTALDENGLVAYVRGLQGKEVWLLIDDVTRADGSWTVGIKALGLKKEDLPRMRGAAKAPKKGAAKPGGALPPPER